MAKVKDQVLPGSDISYIDSTGIVHYDADLVRHIMPNAYPLPSLNPTGIARVTARNKRPSHQGPGSPDQAIQRRCFRNCVDLWYSLPRQCPEAPMCHGRPSIENVWQQKVDQGVMCSYYDLFMSCCMSKCQTDGTIGTGDLGCFDCPAIEEPPCAPGFTSEGMSVGESQDLACVAIDPCCSCPDCTMTLVSGGGELVNNEDGTWTYNAPDENPDCENNPSFELCCDGYDCVTLDIAVNADLDNVNGAFRQWFPIDCWISWPGYVWQSINMKQWSCSGQLIYEGEQTYWGTDCGDAISRVSEIMGGGSGVFIDIRSADQLAAGCCPPELL